jgi:hypothetical protein
VTNREWLQCDDPKPLLEFALKKRNRKMRLAAVAACRLFWLEMPDDRSRNALEVAERFADDQATADEQEEARASAKLVTKVLFDAARAAVDSPSPTGDAEIELAQSLDLAEAAVAASSSEPEGTFFYLSSILGYEFLIARLVGDVLGPPARVSFNPAWLSPTVTALANSIYDQNQFDQMPQLADALAGAGCTDAAILEHCRHTDPRFGPLPQHARGCWVLDLLLGKA